MPATLAMSEQTVQFPNRRLLRIKQVEEKTGFKRAHLYALMREGKFPKSVHLGIRSVGWDSIEIDRWIAERIAERNVEQFQGQDFAPSAADYRVLKNKHPVNAERHILRLGEVEEKTNLDGKRIYELIAMNDFPRPIPLGKRSVGWNSDEINQWLVKQAVDQMADQYKEYA
jgi:prophage regulatory protein